MGNLSQTNNHTGRFTTSAIAFLALIGVGTIGYKLIEGPHWTWLDSLYMTVITLGTIGYGEVHTLGTGGRLFTVCLILMGAGVMAYTVTAMAQFVVEGKLQELWGKKRMKDRIDALKDHYVVCGAGDTGLVVIGELTRRKIPFVVVESNPKVAESLIEGDILVVEGDAT
ncbi:MAG TPA: ion channel, partial [Candidatus Ozemobacteraceae bacterium]|nr:ion channel [Candidatus Ozemobacteraceae bacterium]